MNLNYFERKGFAEGFANAFLEGYRDTLGRQLKDRELKKARFSIVRYLRKKGIEEENIVRATRSLPTKQISAFTHTARRKLTTSKKPSRAGVRARVGSRSKN